MKIIIAIDLSAGALFYYYYILISVRARRKRGNEASRFRVPFRRPSTPRENTAPVVFVSQLETAKLDLIYRYLENNAMHSIREYSRVAISEGKKRRARILMVESAA